MQTDYDKLVDVQEISGILEHCTFEDILSAKSLLMNGLNLWNSTRRIPSGIITCF